ncbi:MAG: hypothetical protein JSV51_09675 [Candidatus Bathyarchaeota archaeon]|nr:MAG: hypothetical protein JSV51_09675 [Candidatus Bathyarchaeota archaeon]
MTRSLITHNTSPFNVNASLPYDIERGIFIIEKLQENTARLTSEILKEEKIVKLAQRRDRHDIIAEILKTARRGEKKTYIMYKARLSHSQLKLYLELLNKSGMIVNDNGVFRTTPKGLAFVREFEAMNFLFRQ